MAAKTLSRACADDVLDVLPDAMDAIRSGMRSQLDTRLSVPQFRCLNFVDRQPGCSLGELAAFLGVTMPTASAMVDRLVRAGYALLHLVTYFTVGPKETRAWTITTGTKAPQAAGVIHTDFEKGFIRAETIAYDDYVATGGEAGARDAGKMRLEGKDYVVADGDVMHFRFAT